MNKQGPNGIGWTDETWNPVIGCSKISEGCKNCYAEKMAGRLYRMDLTLMSGTGYNRSLNAYTDVVCPKYFTWNGQCCLRSDEILNKPLHWKKPRKIFVNSMGDLFHENVPFGWVDKIKAVITGCTQQTFQILTKRADRLLEYANRPGGVNFPPNLWLGVTAENQRWADERIPTLLQIPAAVRFVSLEPLLDEIDLREIDCSAWETTTIVDGLAGIITEDSDTEIVGADADGKIDWVIVGAETGPGRRPCKIEWVESIVDQCAAADVPCWVKQIEIDGKISHDMNEWPEKLRVRQWPGVVKNE